MVYLTMYLAGTMHVYDQKGLSAKTWVLLAPLSAAALTCASRSRDHRPSSLADVALGLRPLQPSRALWTTDITPRTLSPARSSAS
jgi:hypothetical protein